MPRKAKNISILQISPAEIVHLRISGGEGKRLEILDYGRTAGAWSAEDGSLSAAVAEHAAGAGIQDDAIYTILPRHDVTLRILDMPSQDPSEIANMVALSAEEFVPFSIEELVVDQQILEKHESGESRVLVVMAHKDVVEGHVKLLDASGLRPSGIYLSSACLASAAFAAPPAASGRYALAHLSGLGLEVAVVEEEQFLFSRGVAGAIDCHALDEPSPEMVEELAAELRASLSAYRRQSEDGLPAESVYLVCDESRLGNALPLLAEAMTREVGTGEHLLKLAPAGEASLRGVPALLLGGALTALGRAKLVVDLAPDSLRKGRALAAAKENALYYAGLAAVVVLALVVLFVQSLLQGRAVLAELNERVAEIEPSAQGIAEKHQQLRILEQQVTGQSDAIELISLAVRPAPQKDFNITSIHYNREAGMELWGRAGTRDEVKQYLEGLRALGTELGVTLLQNASEDYTSESVEDHTKVFFYHVELPYPEQAPAE